MNPINSASTIPEMLAGLAATRGAHDAIATMTRTVTYADLDAESARMARALLAIGAGKSLRIALIAPDGLLWATTFLAALRIGALITCISTMATPKELAHILRNSDTQVLICARRFLGHDYGRTIEAAFPQVVNCGPERIRLPEAPFLRSAWFDDPEGLSWAGSLHELEELAEEIPQTILAGVEAQVAPSDDAVIVYTSGSTSLPKAVVHPQWNVVRHPCALAALFLIRPEDRMLPMLPAFWLGGMAMFLQVLSQGATLVYPPSPDLEEVVATIKALGVNRLNGWGDGLARLRELAPRRDIDVEAIVGLGPFRDEAGELIPVEFQSGMLGMSESFAPHSAEPLNYRMPADKPFACGRAVGGFERRVVDPETGIEVALGEVGELQLRGGALMSGMYKRCRSELFTADGFYPTGDLVLIDEDDCLYFVARRNDMIKTRAANVSRLEVEAALNELPDVAMAVVTGLDDPDFGQVVAAAIVPVAGSSPQPDSVRAALRETLSSYKVPRKIVFIEESQIPRTATGKLKLHELAQLFGA